MVTQAPRPSRRLVRIVVLALALLILLAGGYAFLKLRNPVNQARRLQEQARLALRVGKPAEAAQKLEAAVALLPDRPALAVELADVYAILGRPEDAERQLRAANERTPGDATLAAALATRLVARGAADEAWTLFEPLLPKIRALTDPVRRSRALIAAGRAAAARGAIPEAEGFLREAAVGEARADALLALAEALERAGRLAGAERALAEARKEAPDDLRLALAHARALERFGRPDEAIGVLEALVAAAPDRRVEVASTLAEILIRAGRREKALALAQDLAKNPRGLGVAAYVRGAVALAEGDAAGAETEFGRMAQVIPGSAEARLLVARAAARAGAPERAREALEAALALRPGLKEAELGLLELAEQARDLDSVRTRAEPLLADPATRPRALRSLLATYGADPKAGLARLEALGRQFPEDRSLGLYAAIFRVLSGNSEGGTAELRRIAETDPDLPGAFAALARVTEGSSDALEAIEQLAALSAKDPRLAAARVPLAGIYERLGRADLAARELEAAIRDRPDLREARLARAQLAARAKDVPRAIVEIEKLLGESPRDLGLLQTLAALRLDAGEPAAAADLFKRARELAPGDAMTEARLGRAQALAGDDAGALASFEAARRLNPRLPAAHEDGALHLARGDILKAGTALERALAATGDPRFGAALAAVRAIAGDPGGATELAAGWRARNARSPAAALAQAMLLSLAGDRRRAEEVARAAAVPEPVRTAAVRVERGPAGALDPKTRFALEIFALKVLGWEAEVRTRAERVAGEGGADALLVWWALGAAGAGDPRVRLALARKLAALAPDDVGAGSELATAELAAGDPAGELETLGALERRFPENPQVQLQLGMALERAGRIDAAIERYARAAEADSPAAAALNNTAYLLAGDPARRAIALSYARRAARIAPDVGPILDTLGWVLFRDGQVEDALPVLERAAALSPAIPTIRYHLARVLEARGQGERAARHLEVALLSGEGFDDAPAARALLERLRAEEAAGAPATGKEIRRIGPGESVEAALGEDGVAAFSVGPAEGPREVRLRYRSPAGAASTVTLALGGAPYKRIEAGPGGEVVIPRLALAPAGHVVTVRASGAKVPKTPFLLALEPAAPPAGERREVEPDERAAEAPALEVGEAAAGALDAPADRDHLRLAIPRGARATCAISAGPRGELRLEILSVTGARERSLKLVHLPAGWEVEIQGLAAPTASALVLRVSAGALLAAPPAGAAAGEAIDYRVRLALAPADAALDPEPDDRIEDAVAIAPGARRPGTVGGPADPIDWYRIEAPAGRTIALEVRAVPSAPPAAALAAELWELAGDRARPLRAWPLIERDLFVPRWRAPREGSALVLGLRPARAGAPPAPYEVSLEEAPPREGPVETEPNDEPALADSASGDGPTASFRGTLDGAADRDWVSVPPLAAGTVLSISLKAGPSLDGAIVGVYSGAGRSPGHVAIFEATAGALEVPALRLPDGPAAIVVASVRGAAGPYDLAFSSARAPGDVEVEPNDEPAAAATLAPGHPLKGRISGRADRDLFRLDGQPALALRATGGAPIAVRVRREGAVESVVPPGGHIELGPDALGGAGPALIEVSLPSGAAASAVAGATYEVEAK